MINLLFLAPYKSLDIEIDNLYRHFTQLSSAPITFFFVAKQTPIYIQYESLDNRYFTKYLKNKKNEYHRGSPKTRREAMNDET